MLQQREPTKIEQQIEREAWLGGYAGRSNLLAIDNITSHQVLFAFYKIPSTCILSNRVNDNKCDVAKLALEKVGGNTLISTNNIYVCIKKRAAVLRQFSPLVLCFLRLCIRGTYYLEENCLQHSVYNKHLKIYQIAYLCICMYTYNCDWIYNKYRDINNRLVRFYLN